MKKSAKPAVLKIVLEVNGKELSLSVEDAKALREALDNVLGKTTYIPAPYPYYSPWIVRYYDTSGTSTTYVSGEIPSTATLTCNSSTALLSQ